MAFKIDELHSEALKSIAQRIDDGNRNIEENEIVLFAREVKSQKTQLKPEDYDEAYKLLEKQSQLREKKPKIVQSHYDEKEMQKTAKKSCVGGAIGGALSGIAIGALICPLAILPCAAVLGVIGGLAGFATTPMAMAAEEMRNPQYEEIWVYDNDYNNYGEVAFNLLNVEG